MIGLDVKADIKKTEKHLDATRRKHIPKATSRALNRSITKVRTDTRRELSKRMGVPQKRIKDNFFLKKASPTNLIATFLGKGAPIKLIFFKGTRQIKRGVKSAAYGVKKLYKGTFITNVGAGHKGVFKRKHEDRLPIQELYGPGVPQAMAEEEIQKNMQTTGSRTFTKEFKRQSEKVLK